MRQASIAALIGSHRPVVVQDNRRRTLCMARLCETLWPGGRTQRHTKKLFRLLRSGLPFWAPRLGAGAYWRTQGARARRKTMFRSGLVKSACVAITLSGLSAPPAGAIEMVQGLDPSAGLKPRADLESGGNQSRTRWRRPRPRRLRRPRAARGGSMATGPVTPVGGLPWRRLPVWRLGRLGSARLVTGAQAARSRPARHARRSASSPTRP